MTYEEISLLLKSNTTVKLLTADIRKVTDEGFLRKLKNEEERYEINCIIKAFINADLVQQTLEKDTNHRNDPDENGGA